MAKDNKKKSDMTATQKALQKARRDNSKKTNKQKQESRMDYWRGVKLEMKKVVWPTRQELTSYTVVVIATCALFALGFWVVDTGVLAFLKAVLGVTLS